MNLFISTATDKIYLALFDDHKIIQKIVHQGHNDHTKSLYQLLDQLELDETKLEKIYVVTGPGSFTGLRVGVVYAKLLAQKTKLDIYPVNLISLLESMYQQPVAIDARGKSHYVFNDNNEIVITQELNSNYVVDPLIDIDSLYQNDYLKSIKPVNYLDVRIEYVKSPIC